MLFAQTIKAAFPPPCLWVLISQKWINSLSLGLNIDTCKVSYKNNAQHSSSSTRTEATQEKQRPSAMKCSLHRSHPSFYPHHPAAAGTASGMAARKNTRRRTMQPPDDSFSQNINRRETGRFRSAASASLTRTRMRPGGEGRGAMTAPLKSKTHSWEQRKNYLHFSINSVTHSHHYQYIYEIHHLWKKREGVGDKKMPISRKPREVTLPHAA